MSDFLRIEGARTRITIAPAFGGRIAQIEALHNDTWTALLWEPTETPIADRDPMSWGAFVMAPWPNRIAHGRFTWRDATHRVPPNLEGHAVHGVCFDRPWRIDAASETSCALSIDFDDRWPLGGRAIHIIEALDDGVSMTVEVHATNGPFPAGVGWHPWLRRDIGGAEHLHAQVDAELRYELDAKIPTGRLIAVDGAHDLRAYPPLGDRRIDACYPHPAGPLRLRWNDLELWMESSDNVTHAVAYTPEHAVSVEPQTCAIDAFNLALDAHDTDTGVIVVEPGRPLVATTIWRWAAVPGIRNLFLRR